MDSEILSTFRAYPVRLSVSLFLLLPTAVLLLTDGISEFAYQKDLVEITLAPGEYALADCDRSDSERGTDDFSDRHCLEIVPVRASEEEVGRITYYGYEPNFDQLMRIRGSTEPLTLWYAREESTILFTRFGTLRAARLGEQYLVDIVNTFLSRRRLAARASTVGLFLMLIPIPWLLHRPITEYLTRKGL
jgi:hypothetical protein